MLALTLDLDGGRAEVRFSDRADGDFAAAHADLRGGLAAGPWTRLRQQHGSEVVVVAAPGDGDGALADAAVTAAPGAVLTVRTADCAPVALVAREGVVAAVHAGWRGLVAGVVEGAAATVRALGGKEVSAYLGPCIHAECYEFGSGSLAELADRLGSEVIGRTAWGTPAFDIPAAVRRALRRSGIQTIIEAHLCTACDAGRWYSHRARGEPERHLLATWISRS